MTPEKISVFLTSAHNKPAGGVKILNQVCLFRKKGHEGYVVVPEDPNEAYGWEKLFTEEMVKAYHIDYGLNIRIVRYHN